MTNLALFEDDGSENPGKVVRDILLQLFPSQNEKAEGSSDFLRNLDDALLADGELVKAVYNSVINYAARRLIKMAQHKHRKYSGDDSYPGESLDRIRSFLSHNTTIDATFQNKLSILLYTAAKEHRNRSKALKEQIFNRSKELGARCYICGRDLSFDDSAGHLFAQVEHLWPVTMGGSNVESNMKLACRACNNVKASYVDAYDFHFEHFVSQLEEGDASFNKEFNWEFKVASYLKAGCQCAECGKSSDDGELKFLRLNTSDCWHYLNIQPYCHEHYQLFSSIRGGQTE
ncbi:hypothetical protein GCM10017784_27720 [Deinococcus indicus]|uniref:HNH endonuclease n=1 Tax=Deinococcus indicus TaxID=223556 RepID=UPI00174982C8|nr:HNH endonuclease [Deinococcus indicus]GHG32632.1 hypothetical protein GCM10017784_27720 [Deinococcus indicus]